MKKDEKQIIKCDVYDCKYCNCSDNYCTLKSIKVCNCDCGCDKEGTMCNSYKGK